jgi:hypothetical protein
MNWIKAAQPAGDLEEMELYVGRLFAGRILSWALVGKRKPEKRYQQLPDKLSEQYIWI